MRLPFLLSAVVVLCAGCLGTPSEADTPEVAPAEIPPETHRFKGRFAVAAEEPPQTHRFPVANGSGEVEGLLTWSAPGAQLGFAFVDPSGETVANGWAEGPGRAYVTTTHPPEPGEWQVVVEGARGVDVAYTMAVTQRPAAPYGPIEEVFELPGRNAARDLPDGARQEAYPLLPRDFAEINLNMVPGDHFTFTWSADAPVYFNVHYHGEDGTVRAVEERTTALEGNFTADLTEVYALLWRNEGAEPVTVTVDVDGHYRLHSMTRDG